LAGDWFIPKRVNNLTLGRFLPPILLKLIFKELRLLITSYFIWIGKFLGGLGGSLGTGSLFFLN